MCFPNNSACRPPANFALAFPPPPLSPDLPVSEEIKKSPIKSHQPKRIRKPQKPGKTANNHERRFVVHNYHDHSRDAMDQGEQLETVTAFSASFPMKLHHMLEQVESVGLTHIIGWQSHGRCFIIHKPKEFASLIMPRYFRQSKLTSFQRQLNLYGFQRISRGRDARAYYHEYFLRGKPFLCKHVERKKVKGTKFKAASSPEHEPDFYSMEPLSTGITHHHVAEQPPEKVVSREKPKPKNPPLDVIVEQQPKTDLSVVSHEDNALQPLPIDYATLPTSIAVKDPFPDDTVQESCKKDSFQDIIEESCRSISDADLELVSDWDPMEFGDDFVVDDDASLQSMLNHLLG